MANRLATRSTLGVLLALASVSCTVNSVDIPGLSGPSELAMSFRITATPDSITHDGSSQSSIAVTAFDVNGRPSPGVTFRLDMLIGGVPADYGLLSAKTVVTGTDGRALAVYSAPPAPPPGGGIGSCQPSPFSPALPGTCVTVSATPIGTGFSSGINTQTVDIHLVPLGVILPPADTPTANFVITPQPVTANLSTNFDASLSCGGPVDASGQCSSSNVIVSYSWGFGDGGTATGRVVAHTYTAPGTYTAILTVTNDGGKSATTTQSVAVTAGQNPTADFTFSPSAPVQGQQVQFNASASRAAAGRSIVRWDWNWGDGQTASGQLQNHDFAAVGAYNVTLTVTDDIGQTGTVTRGVNVGTANPTALLIVLKTGGLSIQGDGSASSAVGGATITTYAFNWGDGTPVSSGGASVVPHTYGAGGTYTVRLTVTDSLGRTGTVTQSVTVP